MNRSVTSGIRSLRNYLGGFAAVSLLVGGLQAVRAERPQDVKLDDVTGRPHRLPGPGHCRALVLIFIAHECPLSNGYAPEVARLFKDFSGRGVAFRVVYSERGLAKADAAKHTRAFGYPCPALLDSKLSLAHRVGATVTPEAALLSPDGDVLYLGRIDDRFPALGKGFVPPRHTELRDALEAVLQNKPVPVARTTAIGCQIE